MYGNQFLWMWPLWFRDFATFCLPQPNFLSDHGQYIMGVKNRQKLFYARKGWMVWYFFLEISF